MTLGEISVRGIMQSRGTLVAMVQGPDNKTYIVHQGDKLLDGTIKTITPQGLDRHSGSQRSAVAREAAGDSQTVAIARGRQGMTVTRGLALLCDRRRGRRAAQCVGAVAAPGRADRRRG